MYMYPETVTLWAVAERVPDDTPVSFSRAVPNNTYKLLNSMV
jgi:hypothetical protein